MEWEEFNKLAETQVDYNVYKEEIEPAYMAMPDGVDKKTFINWWRNNVGMVRHISKMAQHDYQLEKLVGELEKDAKDFVKEREQQAIRVNALEHDVEQLKKQLREMTLRAAFAPGELTEWARCQLWTEYFKAAEEAQNLGIQIEK